MACIVAYHLAIYALPFMVGLTAFKYVYATDAGFLMSGLAAIGAALLSIAVVIAVLGFAKKPVSASRRARRLHDTRRHRGLCARLWRYQKRGGFHSRAQHPRQRGRPVHRRRGHAQSQCSGNRRPLALNDPRNAGRHLAAPLHDEIRSLAPPGLQRRPIRADKSAWNDPAAIALGPLARSAMKIGHRLGIRKPCQRIESRWSVLVSSGSYGRVSPSSAPFAISGGSHQRPQTVPTTPFS